MGRRSTKQKGTTAEGPKAGACRKFLALTARRVWRPTLPSVVGAARDPECDCREAKASVEGRLPGSALRGAADSAGRLLVSALSAQLSGHRGAIPGERLG